MSVATKSQVQVLNLVGVNTESELWDLGKSFEEGSIQFEIVSQLVSVFWDFQSAETSLASALRSLTSATESAESNLNQGLHVHASWLSSHAKTADDSAAKMEATVQQFKGLARLLKTATK